MAIEVFNINSEKFTSLAQCSDDKIVIRKISVSEGEVSDLFSPIQVKTTLPTGEGYQYYIHPLNFHSNTKPGKETDIPMEVVVRYCRYTEMIISGIHGRKPVFTLHYSIVEGEAIKVMVNQDIEGYTFSLTPSSRETILSKFKDARPVRSVFVGYDVKESFEAIYGKVVLHIIPALMDLTSEQINQIGEIKLIDAVSNRELKSI